MPFKSAMIYLFLATIWHGQWPSIFSASCYERTVVFLTLDISTVREGTWLMELVMFPISFHMEETLLVASLYSLPSMSPGAEVTYLIVKYGKINQAGSSYFLQSSFWEWASPPKHEFSALPHPRTILGGPLPTWTVPLQMLRRSG